MCPTIDKVSVVPSVVVVRNEEGVSHLKGVLAQWYQP